MKKIAISIVAILHYITMNGIFGHAYSLLRSANIAGDAAPASVYLLNSIGHTLQFPLYPLALYTLPERVFFFFGALALMLNSLLWGYAIVMITEWLRKRWRTHSH